MSTPTTPRVVALLLLLATSLSLVACGDHQTADTSPQPAPIKARISQAERLEIPNQVEVRGIVEASQVAAISARVMAMVTAVHVRAGERVRNGQLLLEIDPQAAEGQVSQAQGALSQAQAALALAERNYERFKALAEVRAASDLEVDMARMQYEQASGAVEQARGAVAAASSVASDAKVTAPFEGQVARKMVEVGDLAAPGRPLMMVESLAGRRLVISVPESLMQKAQIETGTTLKVRIDSRPDLGDIAGMVIERAPGADPASHSFQVKVELPQAELSSGSTGRAWVETESRTTVVVPTDAVLRQGGLNLVVVRTDDGQAASRVVTVGRPLADGKVEILSGLTGGETVLIGLGTTPPTGAPVEVLS